MTTLNLYDDAKAFVNTPHKQLIQRLSIRSKGKTRQVNNPNPKLKSVLKEWNVELTHYYQRELQRHGLEDVAHAYLPGKSIMTNANIHKHADVIQFDFKGFYDSCQYKYFKNHLEKIDPSIQQDQKRRHAYIRRLVIDPETKGVTQGLPVSGALAGLTLIPFWSALKNNLPEDIVFTQYSDDLTFSVKDNQPHHDFTVETLTDYIHYCLSITGLDFTLNHEKTRQDTAHNRKITGIRINHADQTTPSRKDYRMLRQALYEMTKTDELKDVLTQFDFESKASFVGKIAYMRHIDETGKIDKLINKYQSTCLKHDIFKTWISKQYSYVKN